MASNSTGTTGRRMLLQAESPTPTIEGPPPMPDPEVDPQSSAGLRTNLSNPTLQYVSEGSPELYSGMLDVEDPTNITVVLE